MLRVLHVVDSSSPDAGSVARLVDGLIGALQRAGVVAATCTWDADRQAIRTICPQQATRGQVDGGRTALREAVAEADVVHVHGWGHVSFSLAPGARAVGRDAARAALTARKPYLISPFGAMTKGSYNRPSWRRRLGSALFDRRLVRGAAAITAINEFEQSSLRRLNTRGAVTVLPFGLNTKPYEEPAPSAQPTCEPEGLNERAAPDAARPGTVPKRWLLMLAPLHPIYGHVPLLKGLAELGPQFDGWNLALVGPEAGKWRPMLEAAIRRKGGEERVVFEPTCDPKVQQRWLERASALVAPGLRVHCPESVLLGAGHGLPIVATTCVAPPRQRLPMILCGPRRHEIKLSLRSLLAMSDDERVSLGDRARQAVQESFDWQVLVHDYLDLYQRIAR